MTASADGCTHCNPGCAAIAPGGETMQSVAIISNHPQTVVALTNILKDMDVAISMLEYGNGADRAYDLMIHYVVPYDVQCTDLILGLYDIQKLIVLIDMSQREKVRAHDGKDSGFDVTRYPNVCWIIWPSDEESLAHLIQTQLRRVMRR